MRGGVCCEPESSCWRAHNTRHSARHRRDDEQYVWWQYRRRGSPRKSLNENRTTYKQMTANKKRKETSAVWSSRHFEVTTHQRKTVQIFSTNSQQASKVQEPHSCGSAATSGTSTLQPGLPQRSCLRSGCKVRKKDCQRGNEPSWQRVSASASVSCFSGTSRASKLLCPVLSRMPSCLRVSI